MSLSLSLCVCVMCCACRSFADNTRLCEVCAIPYSMFLDIWVLPRQAHHCRACGRCVCHGCSLNDGDFRGKKARVCSTCYLSARDGKKRKNSTHEVFFFFFFCCLCFAEGEWSGPSGLGPAQVSCSLCLVARCMCVCVCVTVCVCVCVNCACVVMYMSQVLL